jgi:hypothetical protein
MFSFMRSTSPREPSVALQQALTQQGLPHGLSVKTLRVLATQGKYAGRPVRYFRVFDPAARGQISVQAFSDLDSHPELVVGSGHMEQNGALSLAGPTTVTASLTPARERADRALHADDEHLVFWNAAASHSSAAHLSEAAATWHVARSRRAAEPVAALPRLDPV